MKLSQVHAAMGAFAMLIVLTFWLSTVISEMFMDHTAILTVKYSIVYYGLVPLILLMAGVGASGNYLAKKNGGKLIEKKKNRMKVLTFNGILIMIPSALFLYHKVNLSEFDIWFYLVQVLELLVGIIQLSMLGQSFKDGLRLSGHLQFQNK